MVYLQGFGSRDHIVYDQLQSVLANELVCKGGICTFDRETFQGIYLLFSAALL